MKRLFFIIVIFFLSISSSFAVFFMEGQGDYTSTGDYNSVKGFGLGMGFDLTSDLNFLLRVDTAEATENKSKANEINYSLDSYTAGIEFIPQIAAIEKYRLCWKNSINVGVSKFDYRQKNSGSSDTTFDDMGTFVSLKTGIQFNFTQYIAPYFDLGFHKTYSWSTSPDATIQGWQADLGVRFYFGGSRDYITGY